jgi:hypothetical protein
MRQKLITHYQLASLTDVQMEKTKAKKSESINRQRKIIAIRILDQISEISNIDRASVLSCHDVDIIAYNNSLRRKAEKYGL